MKHFAYVQFSDTCNCLVHCTIRCEIKITYNITFVDVIFLIIFPLSLHIVYIFLFRSFNNQFTYNTHCWIWVWESRSNSINHQFAVWAPNSYAWNRYICIYMYTMYGRRSRKTKIKMWTTWSNCIKRSRC